MEIEKLIERLEKMKNDHGNLPVQIIISDYGGTMAEIDDVEYFYGRCGLKSGKFFDR